MDNICTLERGEDGCVSLTGALTFATVPSIYRDAQNAFQGGPSLLLIDLSRVTAADSAGLALLLEWQAVRREASQNMEIRNAPEGLISLARLCEADDVMKVSGRNRSS